MARIRTVKPEFFSHEELAKCTPHARLLAIALLQLVDSEGRMRWIPSQVMAHAFPWEALDLSPMVHELCSVKYLELYVVNGREYAHIPAFNIHQRITGKEAQCKSKFPPIDQSDAEGKPECFTGKHLDAQEQGNKGTREQGIKKKGTKFVPPSLEEVEGYILEKSYQVNAVAFIAHYESNGWKVGKNKMKSWKAAVTTWQTRGNGNGSHQKAPKLSLGERATAERKRGEAIIDSQSRNESMGKDVTPVRT